MYTKQKSYICVAYTKQVKKMDQELIKQIIGENQEFVQNVKLLQRPFKFEDNGNYVFLGIRRAGKSYLMFQRIHELMERGTAIEEILYLNFEDERFIGLKSEDLDDIKRVYEETFSFWMRYRLCQAGKNLFVDWQIRTIGYLLREAMLKC